MRGNSMARRLQRRRAAPCMLAGHIDEIGVIVTVHRRRRLRRTSRRSAAGIRRCSSASGSASSATQGDVFGVVGKKPIHLMKPEDREQRQQDRPTCGWTSAPCKRDEAEQRLRVGDAGRDRRAVARLPERPHSSRARSTTASAPSSCSRRCAATRRSRARRAWSPSATTQEEIAWHGGGATLRHTAIDPQMAIVVDVTFATDHPEHREEGDRRAQAGRRPGAQPRRG